MNKNNEITRFIKMAFFAVIVVFSMTTTGTFFAENFTVLPSLPDWVNSLAGVVLGVVVLDLGALAWLRIYLSGCDNNAERALAMGGFFMDLAGSALTTFAHLAVSTDLIVMPTTFSAYVVIGIAVVTVLNFVLVAGHQYYSTSAKVDDKLSQLRSQATDEMLKLVEAQVMRDIPKLASAEAQKQVQIFSASFSQLTGNDTHQQPTPRIIDATPLPNIDMSMGAFAMESSGSV